MSTTYTIQEVSDNTALTEEEVRSFLVGHRVDYMSCNEIEEHEYRAILARLDADDSSGKLVLEAGSSVRQQQEQKAIITTMNQFLGSQMAIAYQVALATASQEVAAVNQGVRDAYVQGDAELAVWFQERATGRIEQHRETMDQINAWTETTQQKISDTVDRKVLAGEEALAQLEEMIADQKKARNAQVKARWELLRNPKASA